MSKANRLLELTIECNRVTSQLQSVGEELGRGIGLSAARWQVLGTLDRAGRPLTAADIARRMGLRRQSVRYLAKELLADGNLEAVDNPDHKSANLLRLTTAGVRRVQRLARRQNDWAEQVGSRFSKQELTQALELLRHLHAAIEQHDQRVVK